MHDRARRKARSTFSPGVAGALSVLLAAAPLSVAPGAEDGVGTSRPEGTMIEMKRDRDRVWYVVNDGVMGGISRSALSVSDSGYGTFTGHLSLANNGGFASVRTLVSVADPEAAQGLIVRVRGDGRRYQLRLRTDRNLDGIAYRAEFMAGPEWSEIRLPFRDFVPTFRGRVVGNAPRLDPGRVEQLSLLIADKREGEFRLDLEWVRSY